MGKFVEQQKAKEEQNERDRTSRENLGKFFYDLAKLVFASMVLVGGASLILNEFNSNQAVLLTTGVALTYILAYIGYYIFKK